MDDIQEHLRTARHLANVLDARWKIFGVKFGLDPILDIIPGVTSLIPTIFSFYLLYIAFLMKIPGNMMVRMLVNIVLDYLIGSIPIAGIVGDVFFRGNMKNLEILEKYNGSTLSSTKSARVQEGVVIE